MKVNKVLTAVFIGASLMFGASCGNGQSGNTVNAQDSVAVADLAYDDAYEEADGSILTWKGFKIGGSHDGTLSVDDAKAVIRDGKLFGGYAVIDMNSLAVTDLEGEMAEKLRGHLLNEDFFEVQTYPTAKFELSDIPAEGVNLEGLKELRGNLTLKDVTKNITIPVAKVTYDEVAKTYTIKTEVFRINRADWNVKYGSKSFFADLGDKVIDDEVELAFTLVLEK